MSATRISNLVFLLILREPFDYEQSVGEGLLRRGEAGPRKYSEPARFGARFSRRGACGRPSAPTGHGEGIAGVAHTEVEVS